MVLLLILALIFITLDYRSSSFNGIRDGAQSVFGPVQRGVSAAVRPIGRFFAGIPDAAGSHGRITVTVSASGSHIARTSYRDQDGVTRLVAWEADLLIHEATFLDEDAERAAETRHSTAAQAAELAATREEAEARGDADPGTWDAVAAELAARVTERPPEPAEPPVVVPPDEEVAVGGLFGERGAHGLARAGRLDRVAPGDRHGGRVIGDLVIGPRVVELLDLGMPDVELRHQLTPVVVAHVI